MIKIENWKIVNLVLLGALMLIPGLLKLFVMGPAAVTGMMSGIVLFAWAPKFWAWVLIIAEILSGIAILARWKLKYTTAVPIVILLVATFTTNWGNWTGMILHLVAVSNYALWGIEDCNASKKKK